MRNPILPVFRFPRLERPRKPLPRPAKRVVLVGWVSQTLEWEDRLRMQASFRWEFPIFFSDGAGQQKELISFSITGPYTNTDHSADAHRALVRALRERGFTHFRRTIDGSLDERFEEREL